MNHPNTEEECLAAIQSFTAFMAKNGYRVAGGAVRLGSVQGKADLRIFASSGDADPEQGKENTRMLLSLFLSTLDPRVKRPDEKFIALDITEN